MKSSFRTVTLLTCLTAAGLQPASAAPEQYKIDPDHLVVGFLVMHIGYAKVLGMFRKASGEFSFDQDSGSLSNVKLVVDTASVDTNHEKRDDHLRSNEFLNVVEFPEMTFTADGATPQGDSQFRVEGMLDLLGQSKPVTLDCVVNKAEKYPLGVGGIFPPFVMGLSCRGSFNRSEYGMSYAVDNGWVGDEVELIIEFEAVQQ